MNGVSLPIGLNRISWKHDEAILISVVGNDSLPIGLNRISWKHLVAHFVVQSSPPYRLG